VTVYTIKYDIDGTAEDLEEAEIRPLLDVSKALKDSGVVDGLKVCAVSLQSMCCGSDHST
jgi:hypothetical protein